MGSRYKTVGDEASRAGLTADAPERQLVPSHFESFRSISSALKVCRDPTRPVLVDSRGGRAGPCLHDAAGKAGAQGHSKSCMLVGRVLTWPQG